MEGGSAPAGLAHRVARWRMDIGTAGQPLLQKVRSRQAKGWCKDALTDQVLGERLCQMV